MRLNKKLCDALVSLHLSILSARKGAPALVTVPPSRGDSSHATRCAIKNQHGFDKLSTRTYAQAHTTHTQAKTHTHTTRTTHRHTHTNTHTSTHTPTHTHTHTKNTTTHTHLVIVACINWFTRPFTSVALILALTPSTLLLISFVSA